MASPTDKPPLRILLWAIPRSLSTALEKCLNHVEGIQIINEPYAYAGLFGPESEVWKYKKAGQKTKAALAIGEGLKITRKPGWFHESICTYQWAKDTLEAAYPGKSVIFCKDMAYAITSKLDMIARAFRHTFLIRHPHKVFPSQKKSLCKLLLTEEDAFRWQDVPESHCPKGYHYGEIYDLVQHVKQHEDPNPVIIDADDLQQSPASILRQYCQAVGIPFSESLLRWPAGIDILEDWIINTTFVYQNISGGFYDAAFNATHFSPPSEIPSREDIPEDILPVVDVAMPYYEKLYEMRIRP